MRTNRTLGFDEPRDPPNSLSGLSPNHHSTVTTRPVIKPSKDRHANLIAIMRTFDDTFSGEKIYPGKVRLPRIRRQPWGYLLGARPSSHKTYPVLTVGLIDRGNSTSAVTARSSVSRTAKPNPSSSNERTLDGSHGQRYTEDSIRRESVR